MKTLYTISISLGFAIIGLVLGVMWAKYSGAATGQGLAGGAIVLGYGLIGAVIAAVIGIITSLRLNAVALRRTAIVMAVAVILVSVYAIIQFQHHQQANQDPPEAYDGIPAFTASIERTRFADPVLAKQLTVNSEEKQWTSQIPDKRKCSGKASAASLRKVSNAITGFDLEAAGHVSCSGEIEQIIRWSVSTGEGINQGAVELNEACIKRNPTIQSVLLAIQQVSMQSNSRVTCK